MLLILEKFVFPSLSVRALHKIPKFDINLNSGSLNCWLCRALMRSLVFTVSFWRSMLFFIVLRQRPCLSHKWTMSKYSQRGIRVHQRRMCISKKISFSTLSFCKKNSIQKFWSAWLEMISGIRQFYSFYCFRSNTVYIKFPTVSSAELWRSFRNFLISLFRRWESIEDCIVVYKCRSFFSSYSHTVIKYLIIF